MAPTVLPWRGRGLEPLDLGVHPVDFLEEVVADGGDFAAEGEVAVVPVADVAVGAGFNGVYNVVEQVQEGDVGVVAQDV